MRQQDSASMFVLMALVALALLIGVPVMRGSGQRSAISNQPLAVSNRQSTISVQPATSEPIAIFIPTPTRVPTLVPTATSVPAPEKAVTWALPVRDVSYKVVGTFGTKSNDSQYVQGLKAVGGVAQTANGVFHPGVDLRARMYSPVYAVADAVVEEVSYNGQYGQHVLMLLSHPDATEVVTETLYGHLSDIFVVPGQHVQRGQVIAISGDTGVATLGPHLHFELRRNSKPINPQPLLDALYATKPVTRTGGTSP